MARVEAKSNKSDRDAKYLQPLKADIVAALAKTPKLIKVLKAMVTTDPDDDSKEFPKVVRLKDDVDALMLDIDFAMPNSCISESPKPARKPKKRKAKD